MSNNKNTNQITDINTLQFIHKLHNFIHIRAMQQPSYYVVPVRFQPDTPARY